MGEEKPRRFFVVLTNVSPKAQPIWATSTSLGYQAISFEFVTADGIKHAVSVRDRPFQKDTPSTFMVSPGERFVYEITLDKAWETHPKLPAGTEFPITLKAIYRVAETPDAKASNVWAGQLESKEYRFTLYHWK